MVSLKVDIDQEISFWNKEGSKRRVSISKLKKEVYLKNLLQKRYWWHKYINNFNDKKILDVGCGTECDFIPFWILNKNSVTAIDISPETIKTNQILLDKLGLKAKLICIDVEKLSLKSKFDVVHIRGVLHHVSSIPKVLQILKSMLKPGGIIIITESNYLYPIRWFIQSKKLESINIFRKLAIKHGLDPNERARVPWYYTRELKKAGFKIKTIDYKRDYMCLAWFTQAITKSKSINKIADFLDKIMLMLEFPKYFGYIVNIIAVVKNEK